MYGTSVFCFHFIINSAGFEKNSVVFFSFVVRFRLVILFYSYFSICWLDFFPNIRFSNRSDYSIALSLSLRVIWSFLVVRIACFTWKTFLCLNCCFTSFSSLKPYINAPPRLMQCIKFSFSLSAGPDNKSVPHSSSVFACPPRKEHNHAHLSSSSSRFLILFVRWFRLLIFDCMTVSTKLNGNQESVILFDFTKSETRSSTEPRSPHSPVNEWLHRLSMQYVLTYLNF